MKNLAWLLSLSLLAATIFSSCSGKAEPASAEGVSVVYGPNGKPVAFGPGGVPIAKDKRIKCGPRG